MYHHILCLVGFQSLITLNIRMNILKVYKTYSNFKNDRTDKRNNVEPNNKRDHSGKDDGN